jgi:hypothetical protein
MCHDGFYLPLLSRSSAGLWIVSSSFFAGQIIAHQDHVEKARSVDALDARHFNVCRGAGPGDPGDQSRRLLAAVEVLGQRLDHLAGAENA